ncbi:MAG: PAS domain-containing sensor histidine kinase [Pseudomonadota bacterium]
MTLSEVQASGIEKVPTDDDSSLESPDQSVLGRRFNPLIGLAVVVTSICCGLATFVLLTGLTPITPTPNVISTLMGVNGVLVLVMIGIIGWQLAALWRARRRRMAGARLHIRIVTLFSIVAAVPALVVALFATVTLNRGLDAWFSERTQTIVEEAQLVAQAYLEEHDQVLRQALTSIAYNIGRQTELLQNDKQAFTRRLANEVAFRRLAAAYIIDAQQRKVEASVTSTGGIQFTPPAQRFFDSAKQGRGVVISPDDGDLMRGLVAVPNLPNTFLYIYKYVDPKVLQHLKRTQEGKAEYDDLKQQRAGVQLTFGLMYVGVAFIFLLAAVWLGLWVADLLVEPIVRLVNAARAVSRGDLESKVDTETDQGDLALLGRTFNQMTQQLKSQRDDLIGANEQLDDRRRFTEAVLSGVSAGVLGLDKEGRITLVNRSALALLGRKSGELKGRFLVKALSGMQPVFDTAKSKPSGSAEGQVVVRVGETERTFTVQVTTEQAGEDEHGYVVTFDDMTELVTAQRNSAWADIARRIAHEIKNPLTPIQLSAERLRRKYQKEIQSDPSVFEQCTNTIIRQVGDIGRMVDEFSSFARMPKAVLETGDIAETVKEAMVLQKASSEDLAFEMVIPDEPVVLAFDRRLVTQAVTNLVKNAREAIEPRVQSDPAHKGKVRVRVAQHEDRVVIAVADNGIGLPQENRGRLTEPYMTTREKGTGLGLAIVKRIMADHGGEISFDDAPEQFSDEGGAEVTLTFSANADPSTVPAPPDGTRKKNEMSAALAAQRS